MLEKNALIESTEHPEWGTWRITKTPTKREDWYHIHGKSGERILHTDELERFWRTL